MKYKQPQQQSLHKREMSCLKVFKICQELQGYFFIDLERRTNEALELGVRCEKAEAENRNLLIAIEELQEVRRGLKIYSNPHGRIKRV